MSPFRLAVPGALAVALAATAAAGAQLETVTLGAAPAPIAALLVSGGEGGDLRLALGALPLAPAGRPPVPVLTMAEIEGASLLAGLDEGIAGVEIHLYAIDARGEVAAGFSEGFRIDLAQTGDAVRGGGVRHLGRLDLGPGTYSLRLLVRNRRTRAFGLRHAELVVPGPGDSAPPPPVASAGDSWLEAHSPRLQGPELAPLPVRPTPPADAASAPAPPAPGLPRPSARPAPEPRLDRRGRARAAEIGAAYRSALGTLAAGDRFGAIAAVAELKKRAVTASTGQGFGELAAAEKTVISGIEARDPSLLLPLALFHQDLGRHYKTAASWLLARHSFGMAVALAETYAARQPEEGASVRAAQTVVVLAELAIETRAWRMADELFVRALALAPLEPSALLGRAALAARLGDRDLARASLDQLLKHQPDHREARLRRALLAAREGDARRAEAGLAELARGAQTDWITALAYQELGRLLLERQQIGRAIAVLAEGSGRLPRDQSLLVALAYLFERSGRTSALQAVLGRLEPQVAADISPRLRFSQAPAAEIAELRQALLAAALLRQAELAAVLGPARAPAGGG